MRRLISGVECSYVSLNDGTMNDSFFPVIVGGFSSIANAKNDRFRFAPMANPTGIFSPIASVAYARHTAYNVHASFALALRQIYVIYIIWIYYHLRINLILKEIRLSDRILNVWKSRSFWNIWFCSKTQKGKVESSLNAHAPANTSTSERKIEFRLNRTLFFSRANGIREKTTERKNEGEKRGAKSNE